MTDRTFILKQVQHQSKLPQVEPLNSLVVVETVVLAAACLSWEELVLVKEKRIMVES